MSYQKLVESGLLRKEKIGFDQVIKVLERACRDLKSARVLIKDGDEDGSFRFSYEAMLLVGRALRWLQNCLICHPESCHADTEINNVIPEINSEPALNLFQG